MGGWEGGWCVYSVQTTENAYIHSNKERWSLNERITTTQHFLFSFIKTKKSKLIICKSLLL